VAEPSSDSRRPAHPTILQIIPRLDTGGAERTTVEITEAIVAAGGTALVATDGGRMAADVAAAGGEIIPLAAATKNPLLILANARRLARLCAVRNVSLIHARSRAPAWSALFAANRVGIPFVTTYHGAYNESGALKRAYNGIMARGAVVIANSTYTADLIRARYATPAERIAIIPRGIDPAAFDPLAIDPERRSALRRAWGIDDTTPVILHPARLTGWKGQRTVIAAAAQLARDGHLGDAVVILAGDDQGRTDYRGTLQADIHAAGLDGRVRLVGHCADMPAAFTLAHTALVASTEPEAFGRTAAEAQAAACPVIATDIGAPRETVLAPPAVPGDAATGWLVPPGDSTALAGALAAALALTPRTRAAMGRRARANVTARFTLAAMQEATLAVYDRLLATDLARHFRAVGKG
jgi:glycosyltransferase involved in cell wall biosynthesis